MKKLLTILSLIAFILFPTPLFAQGIDIGTTFGKDTIVGGTINRFTTLSQLVTPLIWNAYVVTGVGVFFVLLYGGFMYIMGAGQGDGKKIEQGKQALTYGLIGLIVVFSSFWLIQIIRIFTGLDIIGGENL